MESIAFPFSDKGAASISIIARSRPPRRACIARARLAAAPRFIEQATQTNGMTPVFGRAQTTLAFTWPKKRGAGFRPSTRM